MVEEFDAPGPNIDQQRAEHFARIVDGQGDDNTEEKTFLSGKFDRLTLEGEKAANKDFVINFYLKVYTPHMLFFASFFEILFYAFFLHLYFCNLKKFF